MSQQGQGGGQGGKPGGAQQGGQTGEINPLRGGQTDSSNADPLPSDTEGEDGDEI